MPEPYGWTYIEDGIRRQVKIHTTRCGRSVTWAPRKVGDPSPWFDGDGSEDDPNNYFADDELATLGVPVAAWSGFDT